MLCVCALCADVSCRFIVIVVFFVSHLGWLRPVVNISYVVHETTVPLATNCCTVVTLGIGTFKGPFAIAGNGYFSGWIAFAASLKYAYGTNEAVRGFADRAANAMKVRSCFYLHR